MKAKKTIFAAAVFAVVLGGCGTVNQKPSPIEFNYQVENARASGIVQVFDLKGDTVVQIHDLNASTTHFLDQHNAEIAHRVVGENVVLKGIQGSFTVSTGLASSRVVRTTPAPAAAALAPTSSASTSAGGSGARVTSAYSDMSSEQLQVEIARMKKELASLKTTLAAAGIESTGEGSGSAVANRSANSAIRAKRQDDEVIRVSFKDKSQWFTPNAAQKARILDLAKKGGPVMIVGYTDSDQPTPSSAALAKGRADAARRYLIRQGMEGKKITVDFIPAGKFLSENESEAGRAANRRVEIRSS